MKILGILLGLAILVAAPMAEAAPSSMSFAGRLSTSSGPVNGSQSITFKVFDVSTGGTAAWSDTLTLTADNGLVFATLGSTANPLDETIFDGTPKYLEITVGTETLTPRMPINAVPYAVSSSNADLLGGTVSAAKVVQSVTAGAGLSGGGSPTGGAVTLSVNTATIQSRVSGTCAAGSSIRTIAADGTVSCQTDTNSGGTITGVTAGGGLNGGGNAGAVTLSVDTTVIQARVAGTCTAGNSIRAIAADGSVTCQADTNSGGTITGVTAGTGLSGGGTSGAVTLSVNTSAIQARVGGTCPGGQSIRVINADGSVTCQVDGGFKSCSVVTGTTAVGCPSGTLTGGGCVSGGSVKSSYPFSNTWQCDGTSPLTAYAICCQ